MDISKYLNNDNYRKRTGLLNIGATCYINTLIQCLMSCQYFREFILSNDYFNRISNDKKIYLVKELQSIFDSMWIQSNSLNPKRFLNTLHIKFDFIEVNRQNDIHEIFLLIINKINEEIKIKYKFKENINDSNTDLLKLKNKCSFKWFEILKNEYSEINELMYYHAISQIICGNCNHIHHNHDISCIMDIELNNLSNEKCNLYDCIHNHIDKIYLNSDDDSKWKCDQCNKFSKSEKVIKYWKLPPTLVICLKRFAYNKSSRVMNKINTYVDIPLDIDLSIFVLSNNGNNYKLNAVSCHIGGIDSGHYYSLVFNKNNWVLIDDTNLKIISETDFKNHLLNAYMLFYSKNI